MRFAIDEEILAIGSATAIVVLKAPGKPKKGAAAALSVDPNELKKHFRHHSNSQRMALAASLGSGETKAPTPPLMQYYPKPRSHVGHCGSERSSRLAGR